MADPSRSGTDPASEAGRARGGTPRGRDDFALELDHRLHEIFLADAPMGPIGVLVSCGFWVLLGRDTFDSHRLVAWSVLMVGAAAIMAIAFAVPGLRNNRDGFGVPKISKLGHLFAGCGWGLLIWIDHTAARDDPTIVWQATAMHMAITAVAMSSSSGSGQLNYLVLAPMWLLAVAADVAAEQYLAAVGFGLFALVLGSNIGPASTRIRELVLLQLRAQQAAERDPLTGLLNRAGLRRRLDELGDSELTVLYLDLDLFKEVNDEHGHEVGDLVLVEVGARLADAVRATDLTVRLGGDEFVLVAGDHADPQRLALRIIANIERPIVTDRGEVAVSASIGWSLRGGGRRHRRDPATGRRSASGRQGRRQAAGR